MSHPKRASLLLACVMAECLLGTAAVRGEHSGIGVDLAIDQTLRAIDTDSAQQVKLEASLQAMGERERALQASLREHVRALYRITRSGSTPFAGGFEAMRLHLSRVRRLKTRVEEELAAVASMQQRQRATQDEVKQLQQALAAAQQRLQALRVRQPTAHRPEPATDSQAAPDHGFYGLRLSSGKTLNAFEGLRGRLAVPVSGELRMRDVQRGGGPALLFEAEAGTPVRAAAAGRVVLSAAHTVIVDHGAGYQSAYGQLGNVAVRVGDDVSSHALLGSVADDPEQPALLFEIRKGSTRVSARAWLGL